MNETPPKTLPLPKTVGELVTILAEELNRVETLSQIEDCLTKQINWLSQKLAQTQRERITLEEKSIVQTLFDAAETKLEGGSDE